MKRVKILALSLLSVILFAAYAGPHSARAQMATPTASPAADLRITLDRLLAEHMILSLDAMQKGYNGDPAFAAAAAELDRNTLALGAAVASIYGQQAGDTFVNGPNLWRDHIKFFVQFTQGTAMGDSAMVAQANANLDNYIRDISAFLSGATGLPEDALRGVFRTHVNQTEKALTDYASGDYPATYATWTAAIDHMFMAGEALGGAIAQKFPDKFAGQASTPAVDLRAALDRLLFEHMGLSLAAMQKGYDAAPDFGAAAAELDKNTLALGGAVASVYGAAAGEAFVNGPDLWRDHIKFFVQFTQGVAGNNNAMVAQANQNLARYIQAVSKLLTVTGLPMDALVGVFTTHVNQTERALTDYAAGNYAGTYTTWVQALDHMFMAGDALAGAIVAQNPAKFAAAMPAGLPNTGDGTCADGGC